MMALHGELRIGVGLLVVMLVSIALPGGADDWEDAQQYFAIVDRWSNYATHGQQLGADFVIDNLIDARQQRIFITIIDERIRSARGKVQADLTRERGYEYDYTQGGPDVVVGPNLAELRRLQQRKIRDLERTIAAYDAVLECLDVADDRCVEVRDIERQRAQWRSTGDPLPPDPSIPGANDMREMLESALKRHRLTLDRHRKDLKRLQEVTNNLAGADVIFGDRMEEMRTYRRSLGEAKTRLEAHHSECERLCAEARSLADAARRHADAASASGRESERRLAEAQTLASACRSASDADRLEAAVQAAEDARDAMSAALGDAASANTRVRDKLSELDAAQDISSIRTRIRDEGTACSEAGGVIIDQLVEVESAFAGLGEPKRKVELIVDDLKSLDFLDDEVRSWERALSEDPATTSVMRQRYDALRREYEVVAFQAKEAVRWADELTVQVGGPDFLQAAYEEESAKITALEAEVNGTAMPDCDVQEVDLAVFTGEQGRVQGLLGAAAGLRQKANDCRSGTPAAGGAGGGAAPPPPAGTSTTTTGSTTPSSAVSTTAGPDPNVYGGLVITGLAPPARIARGSVIQLEGRDHGGRLYRGVEWVSSNQQVLLADGSGRIVAQQAGEAVVLAKYDGMRAWLDVEVVDPGESPTTSAGSGSSGGSAAGGGSGSSTAGSGSGTGPAAPGGEGATTDGATNDFDFGDGGTGSVEVEPAEDWFQDVPPDVETDASVPQAPSGDPGGLGLLGVDDAAADGNAPPPEPFDFGELPDTAGSLFDSPPDRQPLQPLEGPSEPSDAEIVQMLQQVDCSWLDGGVAAFDRGSGNLGCTCPPGTELSTSRPACIDCMGSESVFMQAIEAQNYELAQRAVNAAEGCDWAPYAQVQLRDFICLQAEIQVLEALNQGGAEAAQNLMNAAQAQGCGISPQTAELVASAALPPPSWSPPPENSGPSADQVMQMLTGVAQSLIAMQGGDPGTAPGFTPPESSGQPPPSPPGGGSQSGGGGQSTEECAQKGCEAECADAIALLGQATTDRCQQCLDRRRAECASGSSGGSSGGGSSSSSGSSSDWESSFSSGSGAWADPHWTMPTAEGGGRCFAGVSYTRPYRYAIACDGNDGSAQYKLVVGGHPAIIFGPGSFTDCQRYLAQLTGGQ